MSISAEAAGSSLFRDLDVGHALSTLEPISEVGNLIVPAAKLALSAELGQADHGLVGLMKEALPHNFPALHAMNQAMKAAFADGTVVEAPTDEQKFDISTLAAIP